MSGDASGSTTGKVRATRGATPATVEPSCVCTVPQRQTATTVRLGHRRTVKYCTNRQTYSSTSQNKKLSYRKQIARQLRTQYVGPFYTNSVTLKST